MLPFMWSAIVGSFRMFWISSYYQWIYLGALIGLFQGPTSPEGIIESVTCSSRRVLAWAWPGTWLAAGAQGLRGDHTGYSGVPLWSLHSLPPWPTSPPGLLPAAEALWLLPSLLLCVSLTCQRAGSYSKHMAHSQIHLPYSPHSRDAV